MKSFVRKLLSPYILSTLKKTLVTIDCFIYPFFAKHALLSSVYYCFFSSQFRREHQAVLYGRLKYKASLQLIKQSSVLLRRNTHRLEKGLIMEPRRPIFAEAYIDETVDCYQRCMQADELCADELKWGRDVLTEYFSVVGSSEIIDKARNYFSQLSHKSSNCENNKSSLPYKYNQRVTSTISSEQLHDLFKQRRSVRWYQQKPVEKQLIEQAVEMAAQAPSACNRQPFQFYIVTNMDKASEIAAMAMGTKGFSGNIPALIVIIGDLSAYPAERDRHVIYIDGGLSSMQLMLAFETLGLSSCPINWPDIENRERKIANKLQLPKHLRPIMLMAVGYGQSSGQIPFSQKKNATILMKEVS